MINQNAKNENENWNIVRDQSTGRYAPYSRSERNNRNAFNNRTYNSDHRSFRNIFCNYCQKNNHTIENCWARNGRPHNYLNPRTYEERGSQGNNNNGQGNWRQRPRAMTNQNDTTVNLSENNFNHGDGRQGVNFSNQINCLTHTSESDDNPPEELLTVTNLL